jgi:hypothetical protein
MGDLNSTTRGCKGATVVVPIEPGVTLDQEMYRLGGTAWIGDQRRTESVLRERDPITVVCIPTLTRSLRRGSSRKGRKTGEPTCITPPSAGAERSRPVESGWTSPTKQWTPPCDIPPASTPGASRTAGEIVPRYVVSEREPLGVTPRGTRPSPPVDALFQPRPCGDRTESVAIGPALGRTTRTPRLPALRPSR